jgi:hypothetical protein
VDRLRRFPDFVNRCVTEFELYRCSGSPYAPGEELSADRKISELTETPGRVFVVFKGASRKANSTVTAALCPHHGHSR